MELLKTYLSRFKIQPTKESVTEYSDYVYKSSKLIKQPYIAVHKRIEKAFEGSSFEYMLSKIKQWYHEAEKSTNPGMTFNWRFKQFRYQKEGKELPSKFPQKTI